jgi:hypothetical protein
MDDLYDDHPKVMAATHQCPLAAALHPPQAAGMSDSRSAIARRVFAHWQTACKHPTAKFTSDRRSKVEARLREGFTEADLIAAVDGAARAPFTNDRRQDVRRPRTDLPHRLQGRRLHARTAPAVSPPSRPPPSSRSTTGPRAPRLPDEPDIQTGPCVDCGAEVQREIPGDDRFAAILEGFPLSLRRLRRSRKLPMAGRGRRTRRASARTEKAAAPRSADSPRSSPTSTSAALTAPAARTPSPPLATGPSRAAG